MARHDAAMVRRESRGFSYGEIQSAGIPLNTAKSWELSTDSRRRSVLHDNVEALKSWYSKAKQVRRPGEAKKLGKELEKLGEEAEKEVRKGAAKAKKEAARVEKETKEIEKKVVKKVEEPVKARRTRKTTKAPAAPKE